MSTQIQFIGYGIHTGPKQENGNSVLLGLDNDNPTRLKGEQRDYRARVALLKQAMEKAEDSSAVKDDTLKIFTVPDFFFSGKRNGYLQATFFGNDQEDKISVLGALQDLMQNSTWENWILVVGGNLVYTTPSKKKEVQVQDIKIPFFKPGRGTQTSVKKPVNLKNLTVVDTINFTVLKKKLETAFAGEGKITKEINPDKLDSLAEEVAYELVEKGETGYEDDKELKVVNVVGRKVDKEVNNLLKKIKTEEQVQELEEEYGPFEWEKALDPNEDAGLFTASLIIQGGAASADNTQIILKPFYNEVAQTGEAPAEETKEQEVLNSLGISVEEDPTFIDPWRLIRLNGEINEEKLNSIKKNKKYGVPILEKWNDITVNPTHFENINSTGIVKAGDLTFAIDSGLDHVNQVKKKLITSINKSLKPVYNKILNEEEERALYKTLLKGVDIHVVTSCGSQIHKAATVAKKGGWVFHCDGYGNMHEWVGEGEEKKLAVVNGEIKDQLGYINVSSDEDKALGNAHTGLMLVSGFKLLPGEASAFKEYGKKSGLETVKTIEPDVQTLVLDGESVRVSDLFWEGSSEETEVTTTDGNSLQVTRQGVTGGTVVIYEDITLG